MADFYVWQVALPALTISAWLGSGPGSFAFCAIATGEGLVWVGGVVAAGVGPLVGLAQAPSKAAGKRMRRKYLMAPMVADKCAAWSIFPFDSGWLALETNGRPRAVIVIKIADGLSPPSMG